MFRMLLSSGTAGEKPLAGGRNPARTGADDSLWSDRSMNRHGLQVLPMRHNAAAHAAEIEDGMQVVIATPQLAGNSRIACAAFAPPSKKCLIRGVPATAKINRAGGRGSPSCPAPDLYAAFHFQARGSATLRPDRPEKRRKGLRCQLRHHRRSSSSAQRA
jgi:hypothetical protein